VDEMVKKMVISLQIILGLTVVFAGLVHIAESPLPGCGTALIGGLLIIEGVDRF
jgi:hypothetical protein